MDTYHTRTVEGMTDIPIRTIQDYVRDFRDHFSEDARKPTKGRRFTPRDIDILQIIRRLRNERMPDEEIRKVLSGEVELKLAHQFDDTEVKNIAANALEYFANANDALRRANRLIENANAQIEQLQKERGIIQQEYRNLREKVDRFKEWQLFVMKEIPELNPSDPVNNKGLMSWLKHS